MLFIYISSHEPYHMTIGDQKLTCQATCIELARILILKIQGNTYNKGTKKALLMRKTPAEVCL